MPIEQVNDTSVQYQGGEQPSSSEYIWTMNFGPQHPATHTTLRLVLKLDGERVVDAVPHIGYLHSGFEKLGESLDYNQYVTVTDRMNYVSPMSNNVAWHEAVERLLGLEIPRRAKYIRVIIAELARISDHLLCIGAMGLDTGGFTSFLYAFNPRETINDIFEAICGARFTNSYTRVGGLLHDLQPKAIVMIRQFLAKELPRAIRDFERLLNRNRIFVDRTRGIGLMTREEAINRGCTGPIARASGVTRDVRKDDPYLVYDELDFNVCCATDGDCYARYLVRLGEIRESMKLVEQALENLPEGPVRVGPDHRVISPKVESIHSTIEGLITHFELVMQNRGFETPYEELYVPTEAPNGELGFYLVGNGTDVAHRARCRPPSFIHFSIFPYLIRGHRLSDVVAILGSLNVIAAELDR